MKRFLPEGSVLAVFGATAASLFLLVLWTRDPAWWRLAGALVFLAGAVFLRARRGATSLPRATDAALGLLLAATIAAGVFAIQLDRGERGWDSLRARQEARFTDALAARMASLERRGRDAAARAAALPVPDPPAGSPALFRTLESIRERHAVDALALYSDDGNLIAWSGQHRGPVPDSIWLRRGGAYFEERPLFSYLYFPVAVPGRDAHAIAALLVETGVLSEEGDVSIGGTGASGGERGVVFRRGDTPDAAWRLVENGETVVSARVEPLTQQEWRAELLRLARRLVLLFGLAAAVALAVAWLRAGTGRGWTTLLPLAGAAPLLALAPVGDALGTERLFSPLLFTLPLPLDPSLGQIVAVLLPLAMIVAGAPRAARTTRRVALRLVLGTVAVAAAFPLVLHAIFTGATPALLGGGAAYWFALQAAAVIVLAGTIMLALPRFPPEEFGLGVVPRRALLAAALITAVALALWVIASAVDPHTPVNQLRAALWVVPYLLAVIALAPLGARTGALTRWLVAGWIAATAVLPHLWAAHVTERLAAAESELETLGTRADPYLEFLLVNFGREADSRFQAGENGVQLLYRTWVASGLAREPYAVHIVLWSETGFPDVQFGSAPPPSAHEVERLLQLVDGVRDGGTSTIASFTDLPSMSKLLLVPLPDGTLVTVRVPPRRALQRTSAIAPFLGAVSAPDARLNLVAVPPPDSPPDTAGGVHWDRTPTGWRSEAVIRYPDGWYHAHMSVVLPPAGVLFARGALLLTFDLALLTLLWLLGVAARGGAPVPRGAWTGWLGSFRARVTLTLFAFFLVPTAGFGWVAYRALAEEVARAAQTVARHSATQAALELEEGTGDLRDLAAHAGTDVLRFQGGELIDVSAREALDLGVYGAWLPPDVHQVLESGEELDALRTQSLGDHSYVTAYRALRPSGTLGVPMSLSSGDTARRQQQFAHLVLFAAVMGALLSLALSLAVGRALTRPIAMLRRASAAVGAGSLRVRLPARTGDEFGELFSTFNRMTRRLRRARARELRTARVLAWGEMARQVAHEIKNPLTPIKLSVQHLRRAHSDRHPQFDDILESSVEQVLREIDQLSEIARAFSRYGAPAVATGPLAEVDVAQVVHETITLYRAGDTRVRYVEEIEPGLPRVLARANELKEVLLNLVENSRAAFDGDGTITVRAAARDGRVEIDVADDGPGIPEDLLPRVFEPHFSTRSSGTGLGLAIVRRLVESWGGTVTAESEAGRGTVLRIRLVSARGN